MIATFVAHMLALAAASPSSGILGSELSSYAIATDGTATMLLSTHSYRLYNILA